MLLETVLFFRTEEAVQARLNQGSPARCLRKLIALTPSQLKALAIFGPSQLAELMRAPRQADDHMQQRDIASMAQEKVTTVVSWQPEAHKTPMLSQTPHATPTSIAPGNH